MLPHPNCGCFYGDFRLTRCSDFFTDSSLHLHAVVFGGISPILLQQIAEDAELAAVAAAALDSTVSAQIPAEFHDHADSTSTLRRRQRMSDRGIPADAPLEDAYGCSRFDCPFDPAEFSSHMFNVAALCNMHWRHSKTCQKGKTGKCQCRMAYPVTLRERPTGPVQVNVNRSRLLVFSAELSFFCQYLLIIDNVFPVLLQIRYTHQNLDAANGAGSAPKRKWQFDVLPAVEPGPRRHQAAGVIPYSANPGPVIDPRSIEYEMHRPTMGLADRRNKDVVSFQPIVSAVFGCNNCVVPLTV